MKKVISIVLLLTLCLSLFAGCNNEQQPETTYDLASAKAYLVNMYQTAGKGEVIVLTADKDMLAKVTIDGVIYDVAWAVKVTSGSAEDVKVGQSKKNNHVLLDINEKPAEDLLFTATATIKAGDNTTETVSFDYKVAASAFAGKTPEQIVEEAYKLENGQVMEGNVTLTGVITMVKTPYDASYKNITVIIQIGELSDKRIECYRLKGEGADKLASGDTITVTGILKNYNGTIEFDAGCSLDNVVPGERVEAPSDPKEIVNAAYALPEGEGLPYSATLTGEITAIDSPYSEQYGNISVIITIEGCEDKPILVYRIKGDGAADLAVGDTITVTGAIVNYAGKIEFTAGSTLENIVKGEGGSTQKPDDDKPTTKPDDDKPTTKPDDDKPVTKPSSLADQIKAAQALADGEELPYTSTLTGKITKINEAYSDQYKNITVTIDYNGKSYKVYRLKGEGAADLDVGDTITVTGNFKNFKGDIQLVKGNLDKVEKGEKAPSSMTAIVDAAYALDKNASLDYEATLTGKIVKLKTPYDSEFKNLTVIIAVDGRADKPIECFRMKGDGVSNNLCVGDTITVTGILKNYNGTVEFDAGCIMSKVVSGGAKKPATSKEIVDAGFALAGGDSLPYFVTLTGEIVEITDEYSPQYKNISVIIKVEGSDGVKQLKCFRMKGTGAEALAEGDTITVTGVIKNYVHSSGDSEIEFDAGCTFVKN